MIIDGDDYLRPGDQFQFTGKSPGTKAASTFSVIEAERVYVTSYAKNLWQFPDETPVIAHWHGQYSTDAFATTIGELRAKAAAKGWDTRTPEEVMACKRRAMEAL